MKKMIASLLVAGACLGMALPTVVNAAVEEVNGTGSADVTVNGTIGMDNTNPTSPIEEGSDAWINVDLDTATVFYNVKGQTAIESPTYSIENKSGRPVDVSVEKFEHVDTSDPYSDIKSLNLNIGDGSSDKLINEGALKSVAATSPLFTLANKDGKMNEADGSTDTSKASTTFSYNGELNGASTDTKHPDFTMTLKLDVPTDWK